MNPGPIIFLASLFVMALSWLGFVLTPQVQLGNQQPVEAGSGQLYPSQRAGLARQGEQVYRANGCFYCHTEQVRPRGFSADAERWGARPGVVQSVDQDYLYDRPVMLGAQRVGPDLANIGVRQTNAAQLLLHLYDPTLSIPKSVMPPFHFLFTQRPLKLGAQPSPDALPLPPGRVPAGYEVVPTAEAQALAAYLLSLRSDAILFETPPPKTNKPAGTNAPVAAATNAPTK